MISSFDEKILNRWDSRIFTVGMLSAYNFNINEGMEGDDRGIDYYASIIGDTVFVASTVVSPGLVSECHIFGKQVGVFIAQKYDNETLALY